MKFLKKKIDQHIEIVTRVCWSIWKIVFILWFITLVAKIAIDTYISLSAIS